MLSKLRSIGFGRRAHGYGVLLACLVQLIVSIPVARAQASPVNPTSVTTAEPQTRVEWQRHWPKVHLVEYIATGVLVLGALTLVLGVDPQTHGVQGGALYDDGVRSLLRAETRAGRDTARIVGDVGYRTLLLYPFLDVLIAPLAVHGNPEVAWQMFALDAEVMAIAGFVGIFTDHVFGRARPSQRECVRAGNYERFCNDSDAFGSFLSGHSAIAAAGAGLTCAHHLNLPLYGGGPFDIMACAAAAALAVTTGVARIVNDRHWATDVTAGLLIGGLAGYGLPALLHYRAAPEQQQQARSRLRMRLLPLIASDRVTAVLLGSY
jgi:membrane-associated phospholipid phosphatase